MPRPKKPTELNLSAQVFDKSCPHCSIKFRTNSHKMVFCSSACWQRDDRIKRRQRKPKRIVKPNRAVDCKTEEELKDFRSRRKQANIKYQANHPERAKRITTTSAAKRYAANPEKFRKLSRDWRKNNPGKFKAAKAEARAAFLNAVPKWADMSAIYEMYQEASRISERTGIKHHVDHIVPLANKVVCGLHVEYNLRIIPASLNHKKNNKFYEDMAFAFAEGRLRLKDYGDDALMECLRRNNALHLLDQ